jgi:hypothetical protein
MDPILEKVVISVASALALSLLALLFASVRNALFYKRVEYDFLYTKPGGGGVSTKGQWDIQWEDYRLTVTVEDVSNDKLQSVSFIRNKGKQENFNVLVTSDSFEPLFKKEIYFKLNSIVRAKTPAGPASYTLRFVFRRRRRVFLA